MYTGKYTGIARAYACGKNPNACSLHVCPGCTTLQGMPPCVRVPRNERLCGDLTMEKLELAPEVPPIAHILRISSITLEVCPPCLFRNLSMLTGRVEGSTIQLYPS